MGKDLAKGTVVSTRIRLARNIDGYLFPSRLDAIQSQKIIRRVSSGLSRYDDFVLKHMGRIDEDEAYRLVDNHLISPGLVRNREGGAVLISDDEQLSIMINEEDHLREQCIVPGLDFIGAYNKLSRVDDRLSKTVKFAYDEQLGYLTACPTNIGTGLRASAMLFLPALTETGMIEEVIRLASQKGLTVRGIYGEGSEAEMSMYQISNERTLGFTEIEILDKTENFVRKVIEYEANARFRLLNGSEVMKLKDKCMRSLGILTNCALISSGEFSELCMNVKFGACLGFIPIDDVDGLDALMIMMKPSNIDASVRGGPDGSGEDRYRAEVGREKMLELLNVNG